ncbi:MAG: hypothetical protein LBL97_00540 [Prevotellaceae bacterium]|jgi:hypothetical protein|nr:hypothetical protein [Prevotellaceae bacterium]
MTKQGTVKKMVTLPLHSVQVLEQRATSNGLSLSAYLSWILNKTANEDLYSEERSDEGLDEETIYANAAEMSDEDAYSYLSRMIPEGHIMASKERQEEFRKWMEEQLQ